MLYGDIPPFTGVVYEEDAQVSEHQHTSLSSASCSKDLLWDGCFENSIWQAVGISLSNMSQYQATLELQWTQRPHETGTQPPLLWPLCDTLKGQCVLLSIFNFHTTFLSDLQSLLIWIFFSNKCSIYTKSSNFLMFNFWGWFSGFFGLIFYLHTILQ